METEKNNSGLTDEMIEIQASKHPSNYDEYSSMKDFIAGAKWTRSFSPLNQGYSQLDVDNSFCRGFEKGMAKMKTLSPLNGNEEAVKCPTCGCHNNPICSNPYHIMKENMY